MSFHHSSSSPAELRAMAMNMFLTGDNGTAPQDDELHHHANRVSGTLHVLAFIQTFLAVVLWVAVFHLNLASKNQVTISAETLSALSALFWILYHWSLSEPLPAAILALIVYLVLSTVGVMTLFLVPYAAKADSSLIYLPPIRLLIIGYLLRAIIAGVRHRRLRRQAAMNSTAQPASPSY